MQIDRHNLDEAFTSFARKGSGVVIGSPGVGKTYLLKQFSDKQADHNELCLYLPIDKLGVTNEKDLREALNIQVEFIDFLRQESEAVSKTGILILDAFDAARSEDAQRFFLDLTRRSIAKLEGYWTVIVSVRTYDAKKSQELQDIFPRTLNSNIPREYQLFDVHCRHFAIPPLSSEERDQAVRSIENLDMVFTNSSEGFKDLLLIPFNLWLVQKILTQDPDVNELSAVESDIQLLGLFWKYRVSSGWLSDERVVFLSRVTRKMVDQPSLSIRTDEVYEVGGIETWNSLMTAEVLIYASSAQRITYGHNILFDYAVSILLIEDDASKLLEFLSEDPSRPLFLRPSVSFYLTRQWHESPILFWDIFWRMLTNADLHIRLFARLLSPTVVVNELRTIDQLDLLTQPLEENQATAVEGVLRILQANRMLRKAHLGVWMLFLLKISMNIHKEFAWELAFATNDVLDQAKKYDSSVFLQACGAIGRNLLQWLWHERREAAQPWLENVGSVWIVPLAAKSMATDPEQSEQLLRGVLSLLKEPDFPIDYFFRLANVLEEVWPTSPTFVADLYKAVFEHQELSNARTQMGGAVLPMTSTRRQDFELSRYSLVAKFPGFLQANPAIAARTAIECLNRFVIEQHIRRYDDQRVDIEASIERFHFRGQEASYLRDGSYAWDHSHSDEPINMANSLFSLLDKIAASEARPDILDQLLDELRDHAVVAFFWKRLLETGTRHPNVFSSRLFELCKANPVLTANETLQEVGSFIEASASSFDDNQRLEIEKAIMSLPELDEENQEHLGYVRDRLIARIPIGLIQTESAKAHILEMETNQSVPANDPLFSMSFGFGAPPTEEFWQKQRGLDPKKPENDALLNVTRPLEAFASRWQNETPTEDDVSSILDQAEVAYKQVMQATEADEAVVETALTKIAECATAMSRAATDANSRAYQFCREVLLTCADHPSPLPHPEDDAHYIHAYWSPAPRIEAARGLPWLAARKLDTQISETIERLVGDPKPSVRFLVVIDLFQIIGTSPAFFWQLANRIGETEKNRVVAGGLFRTLSYLAIKHEPDTVEVLDRFFKRVFSKELDVAVTSDAIPTVVGLAVARKNTWALDTVQTFLNDPIHWARPLRGCAFNAVTFITPQRLEDPKKVQQINNAVSLLSRVLEAAAIGVGQVLKSVNEREAWTDVLQQKMKDVYGVIDEVVTRLYFAAKIEGSVSLEHDETPPTHKQRQLYYFAAKPILEQIVRFAVSKGNGVLFAPTAHYFMQLLNGVLRYDPKGVLNLAAGVAESSEPSGYTLDSFATTEVVKLVEAVLADYRYDFRDGQPLLDLMSLLDIFAKTGDAQALSLVWRLDEIFR